MLYNTKLWNLIILAWVEAPEGTMSKYMSTFTYKPIHVLGTSIEGAQV